MTQELPSWEECQQAMTAGTATPLQVLVFEYDDADPQRSAVFRTRLAAVLATPPALTPDVQGQLWAFLRRVLAEGTLLTVEAHSLDDRATVWSTRFVQRFGRITTAPYLAKDLEDARAIIRDQAAEHNAVLQALGCGHEQDLLQAVKDLKARAAAAEMECERLETHDALRRGWADAGDEIVSGLRQRLARLEATLVDWRKADLRVTADPDSQADYQLAEAALREHADALLAQAPPAPAPAPADPDEPAECICCGRLANGDDGLCTICRHEMDQEGGA